MSEDLLLDVLESIREILHSHERRLKRLESWMLACQDDGK